MSSLVLFHVSIHIGFHVLSIVMYYFQNISFIYMRIQFNDSFVQLNISVWTQSTDVTNIVLHQCHPWIINLELRWDSPSTHPPYYEFFTFTHGLIWNLAVRIRFCRRCWKINFSLLSQWHMRFLKIKKHFCWSKIGNDLSNQDFSNVSWRNTKGV